jgi:hypothetical protein
MPACLPVHAIASITPSHTRRLVSRHPSAHHMVQLNDHAIELAWAMQIQAWEVGQDCGTRSPKVLPRIVVVVWT